MTIPENHGTIPKETPLVYMLREGLGWRGTRNIMAWVVAGAAAYWLWVVPMQEDEARRKAIVEEWQNKYKVNPGLYTPAGVVKPAAPDTNNSKQS